MPGFGTWSKSIIFMVKTFAVQRQRESGRGQGYQKKEDRILQIDLVAT